MEAEENGPSKAKTPISYLQEICMKKGVTPQYDLVANEGAVHEPLFVFKVVAGEVVGTGKGPSKKKAKHNAAISALNRMTDCPNHFAPAVSNNINDSELNSSTMLESGEVGGNPVGELQEMTQKRMWPPPVYDYTSEQGPPHDRDFVCMIRLFNHEEQAVGKSKKLAKRNAAIIMLQKIKQGLIVPSECPPRVDMADDTLSEAQLHSIAENKENVQAGSHKSSLPNKEVAEKKKSSMFLKSRNAKHGKYLDMLQNVDFSSKDRVNVEKDGDRHSRLLQDLAAEQGFQVKYCVTPAKNGRHQGTVELSTVPPCVMYGTGGSADLAKEEAARSALRILKTLTK